MNTNLSFDESFYVNYLMDSPISNRESFIVNHYFGSIKPLVTTNPIRMINLNSFNENLQKKDFCQKTFYDQNQGRFSQCEEEINLPSIHEIDNKAVEVLTNKVIEQKLKNSEKKPPVYFEKKTREKTFFKEIKKDEIKIECNLPKNEISYKPILVVTTPTPLKFINHTTTIVESMNNKIYIPIDYAKDYNKTEAFYAGKMHGAKRLELFEMACKFIEEKKGELKGYTIYFKNTTNSNAAVKYVVSDIDIKIMPKFCERAHISLINKILVKKGSDIFRLDGEIIFKKQILNLSDLLNFCDITKDYVNKIDGEMEYKLRYSAKKFLNDVLQGNKTSKEAGSAMKIMYSSELEKLKNFIENQKNLEDQAAIILSKEDKKLINKDSLQCIKGMMESFKS
jgi:hypothetical protein